MSSQASLRIVETPAAEATLGTMLRRAREQQRIDLDSAAQNLRIKAHYLAALESGDYAALPSSTHARGFLRSYAAYIGLGDHLAEVQEMYGRETSDAPAPLQVPQPLPEGKLPSLKLIAGALCAAILCYVIWYSLNDTPPPTTIAPPPAPVVQSAPEPVPAPVAETPAALVVETPQVAAPVPQAQISIEPAMPTAAAPAPQPVEETSVPTESVVEQPAPSPETVAVPSRIVRAIAPAWVQVQDKSGTTIFSKLLQTGEEYTAPDQPGLKLTTGNAAGIVIVKDGKAGKPLGSPAQVIRGIALTKANP